MAYFKRSIPAEGRIDCSCGFSRRPFADHPTYAEASFHATIFTSDKEAKPHTHIPIAGRGATHETYLVTHESTKPGALIYLGEKAFQARPGVVVHVTPGVVHGGIGTFTPLILGAPGFARGGNVEVEEIAEQKRIIAECSNNLIVPADYLLGKGFVKLDSEHPALSFTDIYGAPGGSIILAQTDRNELHCAATPNCRLNSDEFARSGGPTFVTVLNGWGEITIDQKPVQVKKLDALLLEAGTNFSIGLGLSTAIMNVHPQNVRNLIR